jgi:hypothetical protein
MPLFVLAEIVRILGSADRRLSDRIPSVRKPPQLHFYPVLRIGCFVGLYSSIAMTEYSPIHSGPP